VTVRIEIVAGIAAQGWSDYEAVGEVVDELPMTWPLLV
jgi:hypothetical protein